MSKSLPALRRELKRWATPARAKINAWFFKTGKGAYGEGDIFLGLTVPKIRTIAKQYHDLPHADLLRLLLSKYHEERLCALIILTHQYQKNPKATYTFYLAHTDRINNWDLVDVSAPNIVGTYLLTHPRTVLRHLVQSQNLWERRIAIVSTFAFIRQGQFGDTLRITKELLSDRHDLIHKACGWMLREVGKRDEPALRAFLNQHAPRMPRTMLRYAIERMSMTDRKKYLATIYNPYAKSPYNRRRVERTSHARRVRRDAEQGD